MHELKQSTTANLVFFLASSTDHVTGLTGASPTVQLSKNGGALAAPAGATTEIGAGFYRLAATSADTNTLGILALSATATGADQAAMAFSVVANLEEETFSRLAATPPTAAAIATQVRAELSTELGRLDAAVSTRLASSSYSAPPTAAAVAAAVEAALLNEGDGQALIDAIVQSIGNTNVDQAVLIAAIRADLERAGGNLATLLARAVPLDAAATQAAAAAALTAYDGPTRAEATADKGEILGVLGAPVGASLAADIAAIDASAGGGGASAAEVAAAVAAFDTGSGTIAEGIERLNLLPAESPVAIAPLPPENDDLTLLFVDTTDIVGQPVTGLSIFVSLPQGAAVSTPAGRVVASGRTPMTPDVAVPGRYSLAVESGLTYRVINGSLFGAGGLEVAVPASAETLNLATL